MRSGSLLVAVAASLGLAACAAVTVSKGYEGADLPSGKVALVKGEYPLFLVTVDGKAGEYAPKVLRGPAVYKGFEVTLLPGRHVLEIEYAGFGRRSVKPYKVTIDAEEGAVYSVKHEMRNEGWRAWIQHESGGRTRLTGGVKGMDALSDLLPTEAAPEAEAKPAARPEAKPQPAAQQKPAEGKTGMDDLKGLLGK